MQRTTGKQVAIAIDRLARARYDDAKVVYEATVKAKTPYFSDAYSSLLTYEVISELLPLLRRNKPQESLKRLLERFADLAFLGDERVLILIQELEQTLGEAQNDLFKARNRMTFSTTVLRPLESKILERWKIDRDDFNYELVGGKANTLLARLINDSRDLLEWASDVHELFSEVAVFKGNGSPRAERDGRRLNALAYKPHGMVGEISARIYSTVWASLFDDETIDAILGIANGLGESVSIKESSKYGMRDARNINTFVRTERSFNFSKKSQNATSEIKITIISLLDKRVQSVRFWSDLGVAIGECEHWINSLNTIWGDSGEETQATIEVSVPGGRSSTTLPAMPLSMLSSRLALAIQI